MSRGRFGLGDPADRPKPEVHDLDGATAAMTETLVMNLGEGPGDGLGRGSIRRQGNRQLPRLPEIAHAEHVLQLDISRTDAFLCKILACLHFHTGECGRDQLPGGLAEQHGLSARVVPADVRDEGAERRKISRPDGDEDAVDLQLVGDGSGVHRSGAAVGQQHEIAGIMAIGDGDLLDGRDHADDRNAHDAIGETYGIKPDGLAEGREGSQGQLAIERDFACSQRAALRKSVEDEIGVSDGRLRSPASVAGRARYGTGAVWSDHQHIARIEPCDRAAARAYGIDLDLRGAVGVVGDALLAGDRNLQVLDQADVGRGATHVAGDDVWYVEVGAQMDGRRDPASGSRQHGGNRQSSGSSGGRHTTGRRHDVEIASVAMFTQALLETGEIAVHQWSDVGIQSRRIEALVLAKLWQDLGRSADEPAGKCRLYSGLCCHFVHGVGVAVQETDRHCDIGLPRDASHQASEFSTVESLCHRAVEQ